MKTSVSLTCSCIVFLVQVEAAKWEAEAERKMLENAKMAVLDCPLCGKSLKTDAVSCT